MALRKKIVFGVPVTFFKNECAKSAYCMTTQLFRTYRTKSFTPFRVRNLHVSTCSLFTPCCARALWSLACSPVSIMVSLLHCSLVELYVVYFEWAFVSLSHPTMHRTGLLRVSFWNETVYGACVFVRTSRALLYEQYVSHWVPRAANMLASTKFWTTRRDRVPPKF